MQDVSRLHIMLGYCQLAIIEDLEKSKQRSREAGLGELATKVRKLGRVNAYRDVEHQHEIENGMCEEQDEASGLRQLQPRYPEFRKTHDEHKVDDVPFEEQPDRVGPVLHQAHPLVELPGHEGYVEPEGIEALCRRIKDGEGYNWVAARLLSWLILGGLW